MKMKKISVALLALALSASMLTGCGTDTKKADKDEKATREYVVSEFFSLLAEIISQ